MVRYRQYKSENLIKNLTSVPYKVRCSSGGFVTIKPSIYNINDSDEIFYIVNTRGRDLLLENGVGLERLFFASCQGSGKDCELIWGLFPYKVYEPQLVPHRES